MDGTSPSGALRISAQDVGSRVVLRYRLDPPDHGQFGETLSDLVGELLEWTEGAQGQATVRRRSGEQVSVKLARVVAGKVIPPPRQKPAG
ncbi:hypothetical protein [Actinocrinis sp.]|uniref:putative acetyltransferase n=1 Tax=Actinocrinis sp. TaxID=1920516 RepID=UPI002D547EC2|nr:hypothetical protein [Actinocrinis sp.]HZP55089.1 hypothetical protein [Actinocrinis sp.]